jgi:hypothetical protein
MHTSNRLLTLSAVFLLATACSRGGLTQQQIQSGMQSMEMRLADIAEGRAEPTDMVVILDDTHPLHGGVKFTLRGSGSLEKENHDQKPPQKTMHAISAEQVRTLVKTLQDIRAWEQQTPYREPKADESRTTLVIHIGAMENEIWEWHNELGGNQKMEKVRALLSDMSK